MAGDVDDVIGARHDVEVAVLVDHARIAGFVVAGKGVEIAFRKRSSAFHSVGKVPGGKRQFDRDGAQVSVRQRVAAVIQDLHVIAGHRHGRRADLDRQRSRSPGLPAMVQPVSVCHQ